MNGLIPWLVLAAGPDFDREIAPVLTRRCLECHAGEEPSGRLDLTSADSLRRGGRSSVDPAQLLARHVASGKMPPPKGYSITREEQALLVAWAGAGAPWPAGPPLDPFALSTARRGGRDLWSLQPVRAPDVPAGRHPVDFFIGLELAKKGWGHAPIADRPTLLRRLSIDLTGLPATEGEIAAFERDTSPDAYERQVDRLLESPRFGERRARQWLDVVRWAETSGYERDQEKPNAWKYRDWVIKAFNEDMPLSRFITAQLAGDEMPDRDTSTLTATGMLRLGTWNDEPNDAREYQYERLEDLVHVTTTAFLAMTVKCARCHDHKFDPVTQRDYHRVAAAFWPGPVRAGASGPLGGPPPGRVPDGLLAWTDLAGPPPPLHLLKKGDPFRPGPEVAFGFPSFLAPLAAPSAAKPAGDTTGRRLALAGWITHPANPLTPRVWANRIWAAHFGEGLVRSVDLFGFTGDRPTHPGLLDWLAAELARQGGRSKPLHRLIVTSMAYRQGGKNPDAASCETTDAGNRLLWRAPRRRLDAEAIRDAMLQASGLLDTRVVGGPSFMPEISPEALEGWSRKGQEWKPSPGEQQHRRSLYAFAKRGLPEPTRAVFDAPDGTLPCGKRDSTIAAPQALAMLNNPFTWEQAGALARRCGAEASDLEFVQRAWGHALGRKPGKDEVAAAMNHLDLVRRAGRSNAQARESLALVLFNTNEFILVD